MSNDHTTEAAEITSAGSDQGESRSETSPEVSTDQPPKVTSAETNDGMDNSNTSLDPALSFFELLARAMELSRMSNDHTTGVTGPGSNQGESKSEIPPEVSTDQPPCDKC